MYGFVRVATVTPDIQVGDCEYNREQILTVMQKAHSQGAAVIVCPELCLTGYTCGELFLQTSLLEQAWTSLLVLIEMTKELPFLGVVGLPVAYQNRLYNVGAVFSQGNLLGMVPKSNLPNYNEFYEKRWFQEAFSENRTFEKDGYCVPFGTNLLFQWKEEPLFRLSVEICEDLWVTSPPSVAHSQAGATVVANLSAGDENIGKPEYRKMLIESHSGRTQSIYLYASAGWGESSTDLVFSGHNFISENGRILEESKPFQEGYCIGDVDLQVVDYERRKTNYSSVCGSHYQTIEFSFEMEQKNLLRHVVATPFVPQDNQLRSERCQLILSIQARGLAKRLQHTNCQTAVIGISGGLDSTLALLVITKAFEQLNRPLQNILAVTMPCFGTTSRTKSNAYRLCKELGVSLEEIDITQTVRSHFQDISQSEQMHDLVYENVQARVRTLVLMNLANQKNGLVIGTGDLSELALGWATYNGDHMSMYGVNVGVPKTLMRHLVSYLADESSQSELSKALQDILETPVSPELLPPEQGEISQQTEEIVGPYELHDFFLYYLVRWGFSPSKIYFLAQEAFQNCYESQTIRKWLTVFYRRFFSQQFKRSCLPDGPKIGSVCLSPRGDWRMPSDAQVSLWMKEIEGLS